MSPSFGQKRKRIALSGLLVAVGAVACSSRQEPAARETATASVMEAVTGASCQALDIAAHADTTYAVGTDGKVYGWGYNDGGDPMLQTQYVPLGHLTLGNQVNAPADLGVSGATKVAAGRDGGCAIVTNGGVTCWGRRLGNAATLQQFRGNGMYVPIAVEAATPDGSSAPMTGMTDVAIGDNHACALKSDHTAWCWGDDAKGQLADAAPDDALSPSEVGIQVVSDAPITQIAVAGSTTCVLRTVNGGGEVACAGDGLSGQLGQGGGSDSNAGAHSTLTRISWPADQTMDFEALYGGGAGTFCAVTKKVNNAQTTYCWGVNNVGQTGNKDTNGVSAPALISPDVGSFWAQGNLNGCEVTAGGTVSCWGMNNNGEIPAANMGDVLGSTAIAGISGAFKVALGNTHACVLTTNTLSCWGNNTDGQVGNGSINQTRVPLTPIRVSVKDPSTLCGNGTLGQTCGAITNACGEPANCGDCVGVNSCDATSHTCKDDPNKCSPACASDFYCSNHSCISYCGTLPITDASVGVTTQLTGASYTVNSPAAYGANGCGAFIVDVTNYAQHPRQQLIVEAPTKPASAGECVNTRLTAAQYANGQKIASIGPIVGTWATDNGVSYCKYDTLTDQGIWTTTPSASYSDLRVAARLERWGSTNKGASVWSNSQVQVELFATCFDGKLDGNETGVDCGGSCKACPSDGGDVKCNAAQVWCDCAGTCTTPAVCQRCVQK